MLQDAFILVADDDDDDKHLLESVFREKNCPTPLRFVNNGLELIHYLDDIKKSPGEGVFPKFILLDLNMPKMDGRQALKELKADPVFKKIPVVVFSTTNNSAEIDRCYELGANTYVVKPPTYSSLLQAISGINHYWLDLAAHPSKA